MGSPWTKEGQEKRIIIIGPEGAGKTTTLYRFKLGETVETSYTGAYNVESVEINGLQLKLWDVGTRIKPVQQWLRFAKGSHGLVFMVDSTDRSTILQSGTLLHQFLEHCHNDLYEVPLLVLANKYDNDDCMTMAEIIQGLRLEELKARSIYLCPTVANRGDGLLEGFHWLTDEIQGTDRNMNGFWKGVLVNNYGQLARKGHIRIHLSRGEAGS